MFQTILLATDGSAAAERATDLAASLAGRYGAQVVVVHAVAAPADTLGEPNYSRAVGEALGKARALVDGVARRLHELGVTEVDTDVIEGAPAEVLLALIAGRAPDMLVIGARGMSPWKGLVLGSVSLAVTQRAPCPVLVVK
jgi:nucleotide-binding universal stress UspA family protein